MTVTSERVHGYSAEKGKLLKRLARVEAILDDHVRHCVAAKTR